VSLYRTDLARLDEIKEFMRGQGHRNLSDSEALRLACRAVRIGDDFLDLYRQMQREDGRRRVTIQTLICYFANIALCDLTVHASNGHYMDRNVRDPAIATSDRQNPVEHFLRIGLNPVVLKALKGLRSGLWNSKMQFHSQASLLRFDTGVIG
jgi:hypothetical protein